MGDLYVLVDFMILKMEEDTRTPIILWMPFLDTTGCHIDVKTGKLSFDVRDDHVEFNLFKASRFPSISDECHMIDVVDGLVWKTISNHESDDPLAHCMLTDRSTKGVSPEVAMCAQLLEASPQVLPTVTKAETLVSDAKSSSDEKRAPLVELKSLPSSLRYEFLGPTSSYLVIINANLSASQIVSLLRIL